VAPETESMRLFAVIFIPFSVGLLATTFGRLTSVVLAHKAAKAENLFLRRKMTQIDFKAMDVDDDKTVNYEEFITFMLVSMGKVDHEDMIELRQIFNGLCAGKGVLTIEDLESRALEKSEFPDV